MTDEEKWEHWKQLTKELGQSTTLPEVKRTIAKQLHTYLSVADLRSTISEQPGPTNTELPEEPRYENDCATCVFLGRYVQEMAEYDLYFCPRHDGASDGPRLVGIHTGVISVAWVDFNHMSPFFKEAKRRAIAKGLTKG